MYIIDYCMIHYVIYYLVAFPPGPAGLVYVRACGFAGVAILCSCISVSLMVVSNHPKLLHSERPKGFPLSRRV